MSKPKLVVTLICKEPSILFGDNCLFFISSAQMKENSLQSSDTYPHWINPGHA